MPIQGGINSYSNTLGIKKNTQNLNPLTPPDPNQTITAQGEQYKNTVSQNLNNPGGSLTAVGGRVAQDTMDNLNNPDKNRSDFGNTYDTNLKNEAASGQLYGVANKAAETQRANTLNLGQQQRQTQEALAAQGITPGTAGYARALGMTNANVGAQNLARTQDLNNYEMNASKDINSRLAGREALAGNRYTNALNAGTAFENNARNVQNNAMTQANNLETQAYNKNQTAYTQGETNRLENKQEQQALINSVQDPRTKALLQGVAAQGGDVRAAYAELTGTVPNAQGQLGGNAGTINPNFASASPAQTEMQGLQDELKAYNPKNPGESDADYNARITSMANKMGNQLLTSKYNPLNTQEDQRTTVDVGKKLNSLGAGQFLEQKDFEQAKTNGVVKQLTPSTIPRGTSSVQKFLADYPSGIISLDGKQYKVISGRSPITSYSTLGYERHSDEVAVQDSKGNTKYIGPDGKLSDTPIKSVGGQYWDLPSF